MAQWVDALSSGGAVRWLRPPSPKAAIHLADNLLHYEFETERVGQDRAARGVMEQGLRSLAAWLTDAILEPENMRILQAMAAQRGAMLYARFRPLRLRHTEGPLLRTLLANPIPSAIALGVDLLVESPPHAWQDSSLAISALVQSYPWDTALVFPRLLESTDPAVLAPALDLANLLHQQRGVTPHPGKERFDMLLELLGGVVSRLSLMEENPQHYSESVSEIQQILFDSISLTVSLCHTMALVGDPRAGAKLHQAVSLGHRRIRTEAAYALVKLGEPSAIDGLLELAEDDATRPRVLQYLRELGLADRIRPEWNQKEAHARSKLALQLSQPEWFGLAPHHLDLVDQRDLWVPGFAELQTCFLFRYEYAFGRKEVANLGFSGPFVYLFSDCILDWDYEMVYEVVLQSLEQ